MLFVSKEYKNENLIMMIDGFRHGGIQQAYISLIEEYVKKFAEINVIIASKTKEDLNLPPSNKISVYDLGSAKFIDLKALFKLHQIFKKTKSKIIISNMYRSQIWGSVVKRKKQKLIWVEQNTYINRTPMQWLLMRILATRVDKIICISDDVKLITNKQIGRPDITVTIPNPINKQTFNLQLKEKKIDFIFIARMVWQKNPELMLESFSYFLKNYSKNSKLHIIGGGELLSGIQSLAKKLEIFNDCIFYDWIDNEQVHKILMTSKTLVSTSIIEGMAMVRLEAINYGCCVVTTNTGGAQEFLRPELNLGTFVVEPNVEKIATSMLDSLDSKYWTNSMLTKRIELAKDFDAKTVSEKIIEPFY